MTIPAPDPDSVSIRPAERGDLLEVLRIEKASFPQPWPYDAFVRFLDESGFLVAIVPTDPAIAGFVVADTVTHHGQTIGHVKDLAVHPDYRRRGIGERLLERALATIATRDVTQVKLEVRRGNDAALTLYNKFGFDRRRVVPRYYADGEDAIVLVADPHDRS